MTLHSLTGALKRSDDNYIPGFYIDAAHIPEDRNHMYGPFPGEAMFTYDTLACYLDELEWWGSVGTSVPHSIWTLNGDTGLWERAWYPYYGSNDRNGMSFLTTGSAGWTDFSLMPRWFPDGTAWAHNNTYDEARQ